MGMSSNQNRIMKMRASLTLNQQHESPGEAEKLFNLPLKHLSARVRLQPLQRASPFATLMELRRWSLGLTVCMFLTRLTEACHHAGGPWRLSFSAGRLQRTCLKRKEAAAHIVSVVTDGLDPLVTCFAFQEDFPVSPQPRSPEKGNCGAREGTT